MKHILLSAVCSFFILRVFAQDKDLEAQYSYAQAEEQYSKTGYAEAVNLCERASVQLGQMNQKILFLELKSYDGLLQKQCRNSLLSDRNKIDNLILLYLDTLGKNADREKVFAIMKFKENWTGFKEKGCIGQPGPTFHSLNLGLILDSYYNSFVPHRTMFTHKKTEYKVPKIIKLDAGGLFTTKTAVKNNFRIFSMTISSDPTGTEESVIREDLRGVEGKDLLALIEKDLQTILNRFPGTRAVKIKLSGHYAGDKPESEDDNYEVGFKIASN